MPSIPSPLGQETEAFFPLAFRLIKDSVHHLQTLRQAGADEHDAWNQTTVIHVQATKVSCQSARAERAPFRFPSKLPGRENLPLCLSPAQWLPSFHFQGFSPGYFN